MRYNILSLLLLLPLLASAQTERRTTYMIGVGPTKIYDTYLSQEHFSGTGLTFLATSQRSNANLHWSTLMEHQAHLASADDRSGDSNEMQGDYSFLIGRLRRFDILPSLSVEVGGMAVANAGFIYNTSNGNNPAQARLSLNVMPTATATWRFRLFHRQMALRYETQLPLVGVMFSPNYGQSTRFSPVATTTTTSCPPPSSPHPTCATRSWRTSTSDRSPRSVSATLATCSRQR